MKQIIHEGVRDDIRTIAEFGRENFPDRWRKAVAETGAKSVRFGHCPTAAARAPSQERANWS